MNILEGDVLAFVGLADVGGELVRREFLAQVLSSTGEEPTNLGIGEESDNMEPVYQVLAVRDIATSKVGVCVTSESLLEFYSCGLPTVGFDDITSVTRGGRVFPPDEVE